ncbi:phage portal protein family protein [Campylobacter jejuni]|uniref:phage portal protein family protein n=2 Tax=Campylobacter TaxID=194 RepID=UPI003A7FC1F6
MKKEIKSKREVILKNNSLINTLINSSYLNVLKISENDQKMIFKDLSFTQAHQSRRSVILAKELQIVCENEKIKESFEYLFNPDLLSQILETYLYGLNVFEVNYKLKDGFYYPILKQRDFRNFGFNENDELIYNGNGFDEIVEDKKAIYGLFGSNFLFKNGDALLTKLYFPVKLKNASLKFWMEFLERFGSPWAVAKTDSDPDALASEIHQMLNGDSAVIDKEEELDLIQPKAKANYNEIIDYLDNQIRSVVLGANLSSQVSGGSLAAAESHNQIRKDLAAQDGQIVLFILNRAIKFFKEINHFKDELYVQFFSEAEPKSELCERDLKLFNMGFNFDEEYIKSTYNVEGKLIKELLNQESKVLKDDKENKKALFENKAKLESFEEDFIDKALEQKEYLKVDESMSKFFQEQFESIVKDCKDFNEALNKLKENFSNLEQSEFEKHLFIALNNSSILGYLED